MFCPFSRKRNAERPDHGALPPPKSILQGIQSLSVALHGPRNIQELGIMSRPLSKRKYLTVTDAIEVLSRLPNPIAETRELTETCLRLESEK